ncbi:hypothetical protein Ahy_A07g031717 isoform D [Arachis hypogaea]|uniref:Uncharacterized protein n=1 Tax=Arachis hypogaea TaxID=3818 RepID=A0A445C4R2_ARAHY|nr:hypothetical protein Ahy_A07g031717 isoform D [Arachis hypogaea]
MHGSATYVVLNLEGDLVRNREQATFEVLPRLNDIKFGSGVIDELLFLELPREQRFPYVVRKNDPLGRDVELFRWHYYAPGQMYLSMALSKSPAFLSNGLFVEEMYLSMALSKSPSCNLKGIGSI